MNFNELSAVAIEQEAVKRWKRIDTEFCPDECELLDVYAFVGTEGERVAFEAAAKAKGANPHPYVPAFYNGGTILAGQEREQYEDSLY